MIRVIVVGSLKSFARKVPVLSDGRAAASKGSGSNTSLGTASRGVLPIRPFADRWFLWREFAGHRLCGWLEAMLPYQVVTVDIGQQQSRPRKSRPFWLDYVSELAAEARRSRSRAGGDDGGHWNPPLPWSGHRGAGAARSRTCRRPSYSKMRPDTLLPSFRRFGTEELPTGPFPTHSI